MIVSEKPRPASTAGMSKRYCLYRSGESTSTANESERHGIKTISVNLFSFVSFFTSVYVSLRQMRSFQRNSQWNMRRNDVWCPISDGTVSDAGNSASSTLYRLWCLTACLGCRVLIAGRKTRRNPGWGKTSIKPTAHEKHLDILTNALGISTTY